MSHEVESAMFSNGERAWWGADKVLKEKCYSTKQALTLAGLDWTVSKQDLYVITKNGYNTVNGRKAIVRDTDNSVLGVATDRYEILQNTEALAFFDIFLHEKEMFLTSAISLREGKRICVVGQIENNQREVVKNDTVKSYLLLATSHDGSLATTIKFTNVRTVCMNTLVAALCSNGAFRTIRHNNLQKDRLAMVQNSIDLYKRQFNDEIDLYKQLANKPMNLEATRNYLETLFASELNTAAKRTDGTFKLEDYRPTKKILTNYLSSTDLQMEGVAGTAWAGFNAVTEFLSSQKSKNMDNRMDSLWFGSDANLLDRAKKLALTV